MNNDSIIIGYKVDPFPYEVNFIDLPPVDPICFIMAQLAEPTLTYGEFVIRWQAKTRELKSLR